MDLGVCVRGLAGGSYSSYVQRSSIYKSALWSTWPRAFSNPFAEDNASSSSQPQGQESQLHESLPLL